jgi:predicted TPR repeat methyltransferase
VDVGAGYGETLEAIGKLAPFGSTIIGVEPMLHKAEIAKSRGLNIFNGYLQRGQFRADVISAVDIFSHIPDFRSFLQIVASNLTKGGEVFIETGNLASLNLREEFPGELGLPDHLTFAAEEHLIRFLNDVGFDVIKVSYERVDGIQSFVKNILKKIIGRPVVFGIPYKSKYRQIRIRAKLRNSEV